MLERLVGCQHTEPAKFWTAGLGQLLLEPLNGFSQWVVEGIPYHGSLPGKDTLGGVGRFSKTKSHEDLFHEDIQFGCGSQIRLIHTSHGRRGPCMEQRPYPVSLRAAEGGGAVGVQMVGNGPWHEGNRLTGQRALGVFGIPAKVEGNIAHGVARCHQFGLIIEDGLKTSLSGPFCSATNPLITLQIRTGLKPPAIEVGPAPKTLSFGLHRLVHQSHGNFWRRSIESCHHHDTVFWLDVHGSGCVIQWVLKGPAQEDPFGVSAHPGQFVIHGGSVFPQLNANRFCTALLQRGIFGDLQGNPVAENQVANGGCFQVFINDPRAFACGGYDFIFRIKEIVLFQIGEDGFIKGCFEILSRNGFFLAQRKTKKMVLRDASQLTVMLCDFL